MTIELGKTDKQYLLSFPNEMTIYSMEGLKGDVLALLESLDRKVERTVNLDLTNTEDLDWTGVQIVISFVKSLQERGFSSIRLLASGSVLDIFTLLRVDEIISVQIGR